MQYATPTDRVMDQAIQREVRALERDAKIFGRIMFFIGLATGFALAAIVL